MKILISTLLLLVSSTSFGEIVNIKCEPAGFTYMNQFWLSGSAQLTKSDLVLSEANIRIRKSGNTSAIENLHVESKGSFYVHAENTMAKDAFIHMQLKDNDQSSNVALLNLLVNFPKRISSSIRLKDGFTFYSNCSMR